MRERVGGVVHDHVDRAERVDRAQDELAQRVEVADVTRHREDLAAHRAQVLRRLVARGGLAARHHDRAPRAT
jgi:hypothetical protein